jgi:hypothetical protein
MLHQIGLEKSSRRPRGGFLKSRVGELGRKANDGTLTDAEREEYEELVNLGDLLAALEARARHYLNEQGGPDE